MMEKVGKRVFEAWNDPKNWIVSGSNFRIVGGGQKLQCRCIVHLAIALTSSNRVYNQQVSFDLCEALKAVDDLELQSIAIPAIGTGRKTFCEFVLQIHSIR